MGIKSERSSHAYMFTFITLIEAETSHRQVKEVILKTTCTVATNSYCNYLMYVYTNEHFQFGNPLLST
jgi:hypothetical protein